MSRFHKQMTAQTWARAFYLRKTLSLWQCLLPQGLILHLWMTHSAKNVGHSFGELLFHLCYVLLWRLLRCLLVPPLCITLTEVKRRLTTVGFISFSLNHIMVISHLSVAPYALCFYTALFCELLFLFSSTISFLGFTCFMTCYSFCFSNMSSLCSYFKLFGNYFIFFCQKAEWIHGSSDFAISKLSNHAFIFTSELSVVLLTKTIENIKLKSDRKVYSIDYRLLLLHITACISQPLFSKWHHLKSWQECNQHKNHNVNLLGGKKCGGLMLAVCQVPTKPLSLPSTAGQKKENLKRDSWVETKTGRDHSPTTIMGKTDLGKLIEFMFLRVFLSSQTFWTT